MGAQPPPPFLNSNEYVILWQEKIRRPPNLRLPSPLPYPSLWIAEKTFLATALQMKIVLNRKFRLQQRLRKRLGVSTKRSAVIWNPCRRLSSLTSQRLIAVSLLSGSSSDVWEWPGEGMKQLKNLGFKTAALALSDNSVSIDDPKLMEEGKLALLLGSEGDGLTDTTIANCDYTVKIPMYHGVDSLNVAAASAVAFWQLRKQKLKKEERYGRRTEKICEIFLLSEKSS